MDKKETYTIIKENLLLIKNKFLSYCMTNLKPKICTETKKIYIYFSDNKEVIFKALLPAVIIFLGFYSCSGINKKADIEVQNIFKISDDIRLYFSKKADYWGLDTDFVLKKRIIDRKFIRNNKIVIGANNQLLVGKGYNATTLMPRDNSFDIILRDVNKAQCALFLEADISEQNQVKLISILVENNNKSSLFLWGKDKYSLPIKKGIGKDVCTGDKNTIIWTIR